MMKSFFLCVLLAAVASIADAGVAVAPVVKASVYHESTPMLYGE